MKYVTESLADALYEARKARLVVESEENKSEETEEKSEEVKEEDFDDVNDFDEKEVEQEELDDELDEARWVTMHGNHALVGDKGELLKGGDPKKRVSADKKTIDAAVKDANAKSKEGK